MGDVPSRSKREAVWACSMFSFLSAKGVTPFSQYSLLFKFYHEKKGFEMGKLSINIKK
jgi:hypothetical protein